MPNTPNSRFRVSKTSIGCGIAVSSLVTVLLATGWLPDSFKEPEVVSALTGLLTTIGAAFQICHVRPAGRKTRETE